MEERRGNIREGVPPSVCVVDGGGRPGDRKGTEGAVVGLGTDRLLTSKNIKGRGG